MGVGLGTTFVGASVGSGWLAIAVGGIAVEPGGGYALVDIGWAHADKMLSVTNMAKIVLVFIFFTQFLSIL